MFGDHNTSPPRHERRRRRDVDGPFRVAAGAASIYDVLRGHDPLGEAAHGAGKADYLPTDSPRTRRAVNKAAVTAGLTVPSIISSSARSDSPAERCSPAAAFPSVSRSKGPALQEVLE